MPSSLSIDNYTLCSPRPSVTHSASKKDVNPLNPIVVQTTLKLDEQTLPPNHILIKVDRFGFSANNVTYQALGEHPHFRYFDFHPGPTPELARTYGLIPVWGFGTIAASTCKKIEVGERVYGYFAPTRFLLVPVDPSGVNKHAFYVPRPHLPEDRRPYNQILRCAADLHYNPNPQVEDLTMLYRPLFWTSYWCEDWLHSTRCYEPPKRRKPNNNTNKLTVLISSASSKTAFCLAYLIQKRVRAGEIKVSILGLTSKRNAKFTKKLGLYDEVYEYNTFTNGSAFQGDTSRRWLYVDVAGNEDLNERIRAHFSSPYVGNLVKSVALGVTNLQPSANATEEMKWGHNSFNSSSSSSVPTIDIDLGTETESTFNLWPNVEHFFMPEWLNVRKHQLAIQEIFDRQNVAWAELIRDCTEWVELKRVYGAEEVRDVYIRLAKEGLGPEKGMIWSLWDEVEENGRVGVARL